MTVTSGLHELMRDLYDFSLMADIGPRERLSFWYSGMELALARAIRSVNGLKAVVQIDPHTDPSEVTRRLALVCDLLVLSHTERSKPVPFMVIPAQQTSGLRESGRSQPDASIPKKRHHLTYHMRRKNQSESPPKGRTLHLRRNHPYQSRNRDP